MVKFKGILFSFILAFGIVASRSIPSLASAYVIDPSTIGSIGDLGLGLLGGAEFDFNGSKYQIENYDSLSQADKIDAAIGATNDFIEDYYAARKEYIKANTGFLNQSNRIYDNFALRNANLINDSDENFYITSQGLADWTQYNKYWYSKYSSSFSDLLDVVVPEPDPTYNSLLSKINDDVTNGFWWHDYNSYSSGSYKYSINGGNFSLYSYCSQTVNSNIISGTSALPCTLPGIINVYITKNGDIYSLNQTVYPAKYMGRYYNNRLEFNFACFTIYQSGSISNNDDKDRTSLTFTSSGTLQDVLTYVSNHFRNINLYVDNIPWALVGTQIPNIIVPEFTNVTSDGISSFDVPDTSNKEGAFDITSLFDAIKEAIIGASDTDNTTSGVLTGEAVSDIVVDDTGTLVGTQAVPISTILNDSIEGEATKRLPNIELYPESIHDAFSGTTLLADIILATQQSLPSAIVVVFWGIVICLIIIALIKSLHR